MFTHAMMPGLSIATCGSSVFFPSVCSKMALLKKQMKFDKIIEQKLYPKVRLCTSLDPQLIWCCLSWPGVRLLFCFSPPLVM